jgi:hypothetical protein
MGKMRNVYKNVIGTAEEKRPFGRPKRRWKDNTKIDLREIVCDGVNWIHLSRL